MEYNYSSPKLTARTIREGMYGAFASQAIEAGELVAVWGGRVVQWEEYKSLPVIEQMHSIQVEEGLYLVTPGMGDTADLINHSCSPNCGLRGQIALVALRDIPAGEEVTFDYAMCDGSPYDEFDCDCGSIHCRGRVTGQDWRLPELWARYAGYFSPYLQRRIDQIRGS